MTSSPSPPRARPRRPAEALRLFLVGLICQVAVACATAGDACLRRATRRPLAEPGRRGHRRHRARRDRQRKGARRRGRAGHRRSHRRAPGLRQPLRDALGAARHARHDLRRRLAHQGDGDVGGDHAAGRARPDRSRPAGRRLLAGLRRQRQGRHHRPPAHDALCRPAGRHPDARLVGHRGRARRHRGAEAAGARRHALHLQRCRLHRAGRDRAAGVGPAAGRLCRQEHLPAARHARHRLPAVRTEGPHRAGRRRRRRTALGRGPGSDRLSHGRRRGPCRRFHHRRRSHEVRADDAGRRQGRAETGLGRAP